jgi:hypothetical protein
MKFGLTVYEEDILRGQRLERERLEEEERQRERERQRKYFAKHDAEMERLRKGRKTGKARKSRPVYREEMTAAERSEYNRQHYEQALKDLEREHEQQRIKDIARASRKVGKYESISDKKMVGTVLVGAGILGAIYLGTKVFQSANEDKPCQSQLSWKPIDEQEIQNIRNLVG